MMRPVSLPWLKPICSFDFDMINAGSEEMGDFVNNRCRIPEKEALWPENSHLIFHTRGLGKESNSFYFYKFSLIRKKAKKFLQIDIRFLPNVWSAYFSCFHKFLFVYIVGRRTTHLLSYDMELKKAKNWEMPHINSNDVDGRGLFPTNDALYVDVCYLERECRISYRHELRETFSETGAETGPTWMVVSSFNLPCRKTNLYEFDISSDTRAYDPRDHMEEDSDSDVIYVFNETMAKWEEQFCSEAKGVYGEIVRIYTPVLREIYREFGRTVEIFHPGPDTKASELFACYDREDLNPETDEFETVRDLYRARIRPISLKTAAFETLLTSFPKILGLNSDTLRSFGVPERFVRIIANDGIGENEENSDFKRISIGDGV